MKVLVKILLFVTLYSAIFAFIRVGPEGRVVVAADLKDIGGVPWLYSIVGMVFSFLAAFVVQSGWTSWGGLASAIRNEVNALERLWHMAHWFPEGQGACLREGLRRYVDLAVGETWGGEALQATDEQLENQLADLGRVAFRTESASGASSPASSALAELAGYRRERLDFSSRRMPRFLRYTLILACAMVISLSMLIGVRSLWLDYTFTTSIALLAYVVYLLADDLDNPCRQGLWHVGPEQYRRLARKMDLDVIGVARAYTGAPSVTSVTPAPARVAPPRAFT